MRAFLSRLAVVGVVLGLGLGAGAAPADAARAVAAPAISAGNGTVGVPLPITVLAPSLAGQTTTLQMALNGVAQGQVPVAVDAGGVGTTSWLPPASGTWTVTGSGGASAAAPAVLTVAPVPTATVLSVANRSGSGLGALTTMSASVSSTAGVWMPQGTVRISGSDGTVYGGAPLAGVASGRSTGTFVWNPPAVVVYPIVATFVPASGPGGSANGLGSTASLISIDAQYTVPLVALSLPSQFTVGVPVSLTAVIGNPLLGGSVAFLTNSNGLVTYLGGSLNLTAGQAVRMWTPPSAGNVVITVNYTAADQVTTASSTQVVAVRPAGAPDPLSVSSPQTGVLTVAGATAVAGGTRIALSTGTASGASVNLSVSGPCALSGSVLVTPSAGGSCTLTAASPGRGAYSGSSAVFSLSASKS